MRKTVLGSKQSKENDSDDDGEFDELFPSDLSEDEDDENRFLLKEERESKPKAKNSEESKKRKEKVQVEEPKNKVKTKKTKTVEPTATEEEEEIADGEDIADEVTDFNMSDESAHEDHEDGSDEDE